MNPAIKRAFRLSGQIEKGRHAMQTTIQESIAQSEQIDRYARTVAASKRVRWSIEEDVIRHRTFDMTQKFLPDGLSKMKEFEFLAGSEQRYLSQVQGRTYAN